MSAHGNNNLGLLKTKVIITGANGLLGQKLMHEFGPDHDVLGLDLQPASVLDQRGFPYTQCDITARPDVRGVVANFVPNVVINAAAFTNVDGCEAERDLCWKVNVQGVENLVYAAKKVQARFIQISTDYVFDGESGEYTESDTPRPLGYYGRSKLAAENAVRASELRHAIVRTQVLYGTGRGIRPNFALWLVGSLANGRAVRVVIDQVGNPTLVDDLAMAIHRLVDESKEDVYHIAGSEVISRFDFALELCDVFGYDRSLVHPITTEGLSQAAPRPRNSSFVLEKMRQDLQVRMRGAREGLKELKRQLGRGE